MILNIGVITKDKIVWGAPSEELVLPSNTGKIGILTNHSSLLTYLDIGAMTLKDKIGWNSIVLMGGVFEIVKNKVAILYTGAKERSSIDAKTA